jgi:NTP pyrophosphatase (non-canonical NTP hydrolase)
MSLKDIQEQVDKWMSQFKLQYWEPHEILTRLTEETGELAREINHLYGPKPKKPSEDVRELEEEIADLIFTLCCLANSKGIDLDAAFSKVLTKYSRRDNNRFQTK